VAAKYLVFFDIISNMWLLEFEVWEV